MCARFDLASILVKHCFAYKQGRPSRECQRALAPLVFWSRSLKKSRKVSKSKSRSSKRHQLFLPSLGATDYIIELDFVDFFELLHFWWKKFKKLILMWNDLIFEGISQANSNLRLT